MSEATPRQIQQQIYTRARSGVFRQTEGFDTVAKSKGLELPYIKKNLHPLCGYDAPVELAARGEKEESQYPEAIHLIHQEHGEIVLGRSIYQAADFTGMRSAFLTHNYVIPAQRANEVTTDYAAWLHADFQDSYDAEQGTELSELDKLPVKKVGREQLSQPRAFLEELHMDEKVFKKLLSAVVHAAAGRKKVYISLDVAPSEISRQAARLLELIFSCLPYPYRRQLGFVTYAKEPQSRKGIQMMFVERGSLRLGDRTIEKDYSFDLVSKRVTNVDAEQAEQPFYQLAWDLLDEPQKMAEFLDFAQQMLADLEPSQRESIGSYHELAVLTWIEAGREELYERDKAAVLRGLLNYLSPPGAAARKLRLHDIFLERFDREFDLIKDRQVPELAVVECIRDYYRIGSSADQVKIVRYMIVAINNALAQKRREHAFSYYKLIEGIPALSKAFFDTVLRSGAGAALFDPYIQDKLQAAKDAREVVQLLENWVNAHPVLLDNSSFLELVKAQMLEKLRREKEPVTAVNALLDQLGRLPGEGTAVDSATGLHASGWVDRLFYAANLFLLTELDLEQLTKNQLLDIDFLKYPSEVENWARKFDKRVQSKASVMLAAYAWFSSNEPSMSIFAELSPMELDQVQQLGRQWLSSEVEPSGFGRLVPGFYQGGPADRIDYTRLLDFVQKHARDKETVYQFLLWSEKQPMFTGARGLDPAYATAIVSYFKKHDREAFKKKDDARKLMSEAGRYLKPVYAKAQMELSSPFARFIRQNRKKLAKLSVLFAAVVGIVVVVGVVLQLTGVFDETPAAEPVPEATTTPIADPPAAAESVVYATSSENAEGQKLTQLHFLFQSAAVCEIFQPGSMTMTLPGAAEAISVGEVTFVRSCTADDAGTDAGAEGDTDLGGSDTVEGTPENTAQPEDASGLMNDSAADTENQVEGSSEEGSLNTDSTTDSAGGQEGTSTEGELNGADQTGAPAGEERKDTEPLDLSTYTSSVIVTLTGLTEEVPVGTMITTNSDQSYTVIAAPAQENATSTDSE